MSKKGDTTKTILIIGGLALGAYLLTRPSVQEKLSEGLSSYIPELTIPPIDIALPDLSALANLADALKQCAGGNCLFPNAAGLENLLGGLGELFQPSGGGSTTGPVEHATWTDVAYSLPSWAKGALGVGATALGAYGGYTFIRAFSPTLSAVGKAAAKAIGGAGNVLKNLFTRTVATTVSGNVAKNVPVAAATGTRITAGSVLGGVLPALAFTGIIEGAYQIIRTIKGETNIGMTGVPPIDIINLITGKSSLFSHEPIPTLLLPQIGAAGAAEPGAEGGKPATVVPTVALQPTIVAGKTTPVAVELPEIKFPSATSGVSRNVTGQQGTKPSTPTFYVPPV